MRSKHRPLELGGDVVGLSFWVQVAGRLARLERIRRLSRTERLDELEPGRWIRQRRPIGSGRRDRFEPRAERGPTLAEKVVWPRARKTLTSLSRRPWR